MTDKQIVSRSSELIEAEVDGEIVALHVNSGTCYGFNSTATRIWSLVEQPKTIAEIRDALVAEYEVDANTCETQLMDLLSELEGDKLIEISRSA
ncbi:MAG: PqqD family peptide modification chaperone [Allosphingosinicella sp.]